jgi:hypothetical protein
VEAAIDGEGTVSLTRCNDSDARREHGKPHRRGFDYTATIRVTNTSRPFVDKLRELTGLGRIYIRPGLTAGGRTAYEWSLTRPEMRRLLQAIRLTTKARQQELLSEGLALMHRRGKNQYTVESDYYRRMDVIHENIRDLNHRGVRNGNGRLDSPEGGGKGTT